MSGNHQHDDLSSSLPGEAAVPLLHGPRTAEEQRTAEEERERAAERADDAAYKDRQLLISASANRLTATNVVLTWVLAVFTAVGAAAAIYQGHVANKAAIASQVAAKAAEGSVTVALNTLSETQRSNARQFALAEQARADARAASAEAANASSAALKSAIENSHRELRAWVGLESAVPKSFFGWNNGLQLAVSFGLRNYGRSVAEHVKVFPELMVSSPANRNELACKKSYPKNDLGYSLLPTEMLQTTHGIFVSAAEIREAIKGQRGDKNLTLKIVGCVVYSDGIRTGVTHHTPFSYLLELTNGTYITADTLTIDDKLMRLDQLVIDPGIPN